MKRMVFAASIALFTAQAFADPRIREIAFDPASVVTILAKPGVTTMVEFGADEHVKSVATGQAANCAESAEPWCVTWPANAGFLYVRPRTRASSSLALTVVTDQHAYSFVFEPLVAKDARPATFRLAFSYPKATKAVQAEKPVQGPTPIARVEPLVSDAELVAQRVRHEPVPVNSNYTIAYGEESDDLQPGAVFDDARFTFVRWSGNREIPAVFEIRRDGTEMLANTRMQGDLIVIDRIARGLMLRSGRAVASIRNESFDPDGVALVGGTTVPGVARAEKE